MLLVDTRQTRDIQNGRCVQFKVHFYGPVATRIEQDLSLLLSKGQLDSPTIQVHGSHVDPKRSKTIPYHICDESDNGNHWLYLNNLIVQNRYLKWFLVSVAPQRTSSGTYIFSSSAVTVMISYMIYVIIFA